MAGNPGIPDVQRAWTVIQRGTPATALTLKDDWPVPKQLKEGEVLVKVQAAALNPIGWKVMRFLPNLFAKRPHPAEHDLSGFIVDANGTAFHNGDNIFGWIPTGKDARRRARGVCSSTRRSHRHSSPNVTPVQAAGITLCAMTAYQALIHTAKLESEQIVFVNGGSTAVGAFAIQLAKAKGAKVIATASGKNEAFVRKMGADEFIDYTKAPLHEYLTQNVPSTKYHVIFDAVGLINPSLYTQSAKYLAPSGIFVTTGPIPKDFSGSEMWKTLRTVGAWIIPSWLGNVNRRYSMILVQNNAEDLKEIQDLFAKGKIVRISSCTNSVTKQNSLGSLKPVVDSVFEFEDTLKAYDRILSTRAVGKVVIKVDPTVD
ncbi:hypothetical protein B0H34DRAFT_835459 [Crassisporium funariophilum]|nr:hypothetical protein B0H34DRAFT_835459 [Crassisporium funariophilum]